MQSGKLSSYSQHLQPFPVVSEPGRHFVFSGPAADNHLGEGGLAAGRTEDSTALRQMPMQNRTTHARQVKTLFALLGAMIAVAHLSSALLLRDVIRSQEQEIVARLRHAVDGLLQVWCAHEQPLAGVDSLVAPLQRSGLVTAVWAAEGAPENSWLVRRFGDSAVIAPILGSHPATSESEIVSRAVVPFSNTEFRVAGRLYRTYSAAGTVGRTPVIVGAAVSMPTVSRLRLIWRWDLGLRAAVLLLFVWFSVQFFRLIFTPYQKMRAQAERLSGTGILPGPQSNDVEYVMEAFAAAVGRLTRQKEDLQGRFDRSLRRYENLERFNTYILNSMSAGVLILNRQGEILRLNPSARRILNLDPSSLRGQSYRALQDRYPELVSALTAGLDDSQVYQRREITIRLAPEQDSGRFLGITTSLICDDKDHVMGISVLLTDLTEIKRLQAQLESNRRLADLGEMAAGLAHQLRNSMAAIVGFGKLLAKKIAAGDPAHGTLGDVLQEAEESEQMLSRFLNFARPLAIEFRSCSLAEVIEKAVETVQPALEKRRVAVVVQRPAGEDQLMADPLLLRQVFVNLLQNAAEAMPEGGRVDVRILPPQISHADVGFWVVRIMDTGQGIPRSDHDRVFQPFFTSKETGTGLGLPIARKIVLAHGGHLGVESSTPAGTVFVLRLPQRMGAEGVDQRDTASPRSAAANVPDDTARREIGLTE